MAAGGTRNNNMATKQKASAGPSIADRLEALGMTRQELEDRLQVWPTIMEAIIAGEDAGTTTGPVTFARERDRVLAQMNVWETFGVPERKPAYLIEMEQARAAEAQLEAERQALPDQRAALAEQDRLHREKWQARVDARHAAMKADAIRLRDLRAESGLSVREMAGLLNIDHSILTKLENAQGTALRTLDRVFTTYEAAAAMKRAGHAK
jgi:transcriptional regulator with XRE-family HTH domain